MFIGSWRKIDKPEYAPKPEQRRPYQKPQIIYTDALKTRAGSPLGQPKPGPADPFDPANLFGND